MEKGATILKGMLNWNSDGSAFPLPDEKTQRDEPKSNASVLRRGEACVAQITIRKVVCTQEVEEETRHAVGNEHGVDQRPGGRFVDPLLPSEPVNKGYPQEA